MSGIPPPVRMDADVLRRRVYQWWLTSNGGNVGSRAELAEILAVRLQCAMAEVGRALKASNNRSLPYWDPPWSYLKDMISELRELQDVPAGIAVKAAKWQDAAQKAEANVDKTAIYRFITKRRASLVTTTDGPRGPCKWWIAYARGCDMTMDNILKIEAGDTVQGETDVGAAEPVEDEYSVWDDAIRLPTSLLESDYPPDTIEQYRINWLHPTNFWADWGASALETSIRVCRMAMNGGERVLQPWILWVYPSMNGLPTPPITFARRCISCDELDSPCWYQGMASCTQCSTRRQECQGGDPPNVDDKTIHYPRLERRRAFMAKIDEKNWDQYLRSNGLQLGFEYVDPETPDINRLVKGVTDDEWTKIRKALRDSANEEHIEKVQPSESQSPVDTGSTALSDGTQLDTVPFTSVDDRDGIRNDLEPSGHGGDVSLLPPVPYVHSSPAIAHGTPDELVQGFQHLVDNLRLLNFPLASANAPLASANAPDAPGPSSVTAVPRPPSTSSRHTTYLRAIQRMEAMQVEQLKEIRRLGQEMRAGLPEVTEMSGVPGDK